MDRIIDLAGELTDDEEFLELIDVVMEPNRRRVYRNRRNHFDYYNDEDFKQRYRLSKDVTNFIINEISAEISNITNKNNALTAAEMVLITLRFLATGAFLKLVGDSMGIDESTTSRVVVKVIFAIAQLRPQFIKMPSTDEDQKKVRQHFYNIAKFPRCIGAIDCTHVKIISPGGIHAERYRNRKGYFSYNIQVVCDAQLKILDIVARWPGSTHDAQIFANSRIRHRFENGEFGDGILLGDKGYGIKPYLVTPLRHVHTPAENLYNESHIRTRNTVERCFGVLKRRFPILALGIRLQREKVQAIVVACAVLHNIACAMNDEVPHVDEEVEEEIAAGIIENDVAGDVNAARDINNIVRETLINQYFENLL